MPIPIIPALFPPLLFLAQISTTGGNLLENPSFAKELAGWRKGNWPAEIQAAAIMEDGKSAGRITVSSESAVGFPALYQERPARAGDVFEARVDALSRGVEKGYGVYGALEFHDAAGKRLCFNQTEAASPEGAWTRLSVTSVAPPDAATVRWCLILNGVGEANFTGASLTCTGNITPKPLSDPVTITVTHKRACKTFKGFGTEDDGWFYNPENAAHGVTPEDHALRESRIRWMDPDWVRMFFWHRDWCPKDDWENFTFDSPNMQSHYRTLDLYQEIGACVNVVGVEWGMYKPFTDLPKAARAIASLFEHLIRVKGYTCVQEWTLTNEPNGSWLALGQTFGEYVQLHRLVKDECARRGLAIRVVGSDDTSSLAWFRQCVENSEYAATADLFASHRYVPFADRALVPFFFDARFSLMKENRMDKPFVLAEFGFQDNRSGTLENPLMEEYRYAVWTQALVLDALNRGVSGFSIWCLSEVYYPGNGFMNYGLWNFKDRNWQVRPVYHAWAAFSRLTEAGDEVFVCESDGAPHVLAAKIGKTLFWVNQSDRDAGIRIAGMKPSAVRIMTEATLSGDRESGTTAEITANTFIAPPQSFGYAQ